MILVSSTSIFKYKSFLIKVKQIRYNTKLLHSLIKIAIYRRDNKQIWYHNTKYIYVHLIIHTFDNTNTTNLLTEISINNIAYYS